MIPYVHSLLFIKFVFICMRGSSFNLIKGGSTPDRVDDGLGIKYYEAGGEMLYVLQFHRDYKFKEELLNALLLQWNTPLAIYCQTRIKFLFEMIVGEIVVKSPYGC